MNPEKLKIDHERAGRIAYIQECSNGWKLIFQDRDRNQLPKMKEINSTTEMRSTVIKHTGDRDGEEVVQQLNECSKSQQDSQAKTDYMETSGDSFADKQRQTGIPATQKRNHSPDKNKKASISKKTKANYYTGEKLYNCPICNKGFALLVGVKVHLRVHSGERPYSCLFCRKPFSQIGNLRVHERIHKRVMSYECSICHSSFKRLNILQSHEKKSHRGEINHLCSVCGKTYTESSQFEQHLQSHRYEEEKEKLTAKKTSTASKISTASKKSTVSEKPKLNVESKETGVRKPYKKREKPYECPICSKSFFQSIQLTAHLTDHDVAEPYQCPHCPKKFSGPRILERHLDIHALLFNHQQRYSTAQHN